MGPTRPGVLNLSAVPNRHTQGLNTACSNTQGGAPGPTPGASTLAPRPARPPGLAPWLPARAVLPSRCALLAAGAFIITPRILGPGDTAANGKCRAPHSRGGRGPGSATRLPVFSDLPPAPPRNEAPRSRTAALGCERGALAHSAVGDAQTSRSPVGFILGDVGSLAFRKGTLVRQTPQSWAAGAAPSSGAHGTRP